MTTASTTFTVTDRYGGRPPAWVVGCHGPCEATGSVPVRRRELEDGSVRFGYSEPQDERLRALWLEAEAIAPSVDGWHFVRCPDCGGTGRVDVRTAVARVPAWIVKGARFIWRMRGDRAPHHTRLEHARVLIWCAFGADLARVGADVVRGLADVVEPPR